MVDQRIGSWAFILGVIIAVIAGLAVGAADTYTGPITLILVILGLVVGFLNIGDKEISGFLIASIALIAAGTANLASINQLVPLLGTILQRIVTNVAVFVAPAALVVALKAVYNLASQPAA